jgi:hypothetical protein
VPSAPAKLVRLLRLPFYRRLAVVLAAGYLILFLVALQDIVFVGDETQLRTTAWERMFERRGTFTFEPIAQVTLPFLTVLVAPLNIAIGLVLSLLVGLNLALTTAAFRQPAACRFNRATGALASLPALVSGGACCAPTIVLILGLQVSSAFITVFQVLIPASAIVLVVTLTLILQRTDLEHLAPRAAPHDSADVTPAVLGRRRA